MSAGTPGGRALYGLLAEFDTPERLLAACERVRDTGYTKWDAHAPFPVHGLDGAVGIRATRLPWFVMAGGVTGAVGGVLLQWWTSAVDYRLNISGKPFWSLPANIPIAFELMVLLAALTAFFGMLVSNGLPRLHHPLFGNSRFLRATTDKFFICVEAADPKFDAERVEALLRSLGAAHVERI